MSSIIFPGFIEGVGYEVLFCALSLGGILFCVALRLYNHGIRVDSTTNDSPGPVGRSSNTQGVEPDESTESTQEYNTGMLDTEVMETLRDSNREIGAEIDQNVTDSVKGKRECVERELQTVRECGNIVLRLQYLSGQVRYVHAPPMMPVILFKRRFFAEELERQKKSVRLIFQGRELKPSANVSRDSPSRRCLCDYGVSNNSTIHCLVTDAPPSSAASLSAPTSVSARTNLSTPDDVDLGTHAMVPLFAFMLASVWMFRFTHSEYFGLMSTVALFFLSLFFGVGYWSSVYAHRHQGTSEGGSVAAGDAGQS